MKNEIKNLVENKQVQSKPYRQSNATTNINRTLRKHPFATFGLPFLTIMVIASFGLSTLTQTKFDRDDNKVKEVSVLLLVCYSQY